ncbi:MAG: ferredoxin [Pseudomonadota bacterium]
MNIDDACAPHGLFVMGSVRDITLIGAGAGMWPAFTAAPEYHDGQANPLDRWSKRVIGGIADTFCGSAVFPSDGPPYAPFIAWAKDTGRFWNSPTGMLVHDVAGLMISIRGALVLPGVTALPAVMDSPCSACAAPCVDGCPVGALSAEAAYDVPACKAYLATTDGADCMGAGCLVRRACPVSAAFQRDPAQSAFHMQAFL